MLEKLKEYNGKNYIKLILCNRKHDVRGYAVITVQTLRENIYKMVASDGMLQRRDR